MKGRDRFWSLVEKTASCWHWLGYTQDGYGRTVVDGKRAMAHRFSYQWRHGPVPKGLVLDHLCRNRRCVNPDHLEAVTQRTNSLRGISPVSENNRKRYCKHGHPFDAQNTYLRSQSGNRDCRTCRNDRVRRWKTTNRERHLEQARDYARRRYATLRQRRELASLSGL